ncbi:hypothetical protein Htur_5129 (plasmid) [Haloterrigena turkmenica DSM 5511]|uniref:Uncharacterized protein n=1 Tax=Haloterrigena turkmenica (strain ATCC 51198 / DSM 5511 / JCM 9101 / NCIMB 13204 / VKM B-1734 / 4k) TaxID=543526 RepID=D2S313_HALTV|nr:hypothetical protein Htur_5129 [Haloterrigena turkmenica DSM 5511]
MEGTINRPFPPIEIIGPVTTRFAAFDDRSCLGPCLITEIKLLSLE